MKERNAIVRNQVGGASRDFSLSLDRESSKLILAKEHTHTHTHASIIHARVETLFV